jgi:hypothetical protein
MRDCYVAEINRLGEDTSARDQQHVDDRLAGYLIILYIKAAFPDDVLELFWDTAPVRARQHAMWFLGVQLEPPLDKFPDDLRARAFRKEPAFRPVGLHDAVGSGSRDSGERPCKWIARDGVGRDGNDQLFFGDGR